MLSKSIDTLNIQRLFESEDLYSIPIYQRNYAWETKEIEQLIQDVIDYSTNHPGKNYYIGTLVVANNKNEFYSTIDGQQRLTTLSILCSVLKNEFPEANMEWFTSLKLTFASREKSKLSLDAVFKGHFDEKLHYETNIKDAYEICETQLDKLKSNDAIKLTVQQFANYLKEYVTILRVPLPDDIDLNQYF